MLEVRGISAAYGQHIALEGVSLKVSPGEIVVILGANGAGKSTLLKAVSGICEGRVSGSITMNGHELLGERPDRIVEEGVALVPEGRGIFPDLTVEENLLLGAYAQRAKDDEAANLDRVNTLFPKLRERRKQAVRTMSGGEQQMVAIGRAMMSNPAVLTLDEPSLGLSPLLCRELFQSLKTVRATGIGILLVEQNARASLAIADRGYLLENAQIVHEDSAEKLARDPAVQKAYLGGAAAAAGPRKVAHGPAPASAPSAPRPHAGPAPADIAAAAMASVARSRPTSVPPSRPAPSAAPPAPPETAAPRPAAPPPPAATGPRPGTSHGIDTGALVARASKTASRRTSPDTAQSRLPTAAPPAPAPKPSATPGLVLPDLAAHGDRLSQVLAEIEEAARSARRRTATRPDPVGRGKD